MHSGEACFYTFLVFFITETTSKEFQASLCAQGHNTTLTCSNGNVLVTSMDIVKTNQRCSETSSPSKCCDVDKQKDTLIKRICWPANRVTIGRMYGIITSCHQGFARCFIPNIGNYLETQFRDADLITFNYECQKDDKGSKEACVEAWPSSSLLPSSVTSPSSLTSSPTSLLPSSQSSSSSSSSSSQPPHTSSFFPVVTSHGTQNSNSLLTTVNNQLFTTLQSAHSKLPSTTLPASTTNHHSSTSQTTSVMKKSSTTWTSTFLTSSSTKQHPGSVSTSTTSKQNVITLRTTSTTNQRSTTLQPTFDTRLPTMTFTKKYSTTFPTKTITKQSSTSMSITTVLPVTKGSTTLSQLVSVTRQRSTTPLTTQDLSTLPQSFKTSKSNVSATVSSTTDDTLVKTSNTDSYSSQSHMTKPINTLKIVNVTMKPVSDGLKHAAIVPGLQAVVAMCVLGVLVAIGISTSFLIRSHLKGKYAVYPKSDVHDDNPPLRIPNGYRQLLPRQY